MKLFQYQNSVCVIDMEKFEPIKMSELVKVEETEEQLVLIFQENKTIKINIIDGKLVSKVIQN